MNIEEINPSLATYYSIIVVLGFFCLGKDLFFKSKAPSLHPDVSLETWKIKGLDIALIPTFVYLLVFSTGALTVEAYKLLMGTEEIADAHFFIFGFPMHLTVLVSLFGFYRYFNLKTNVPLNSINYGPIPLIGKSFFYFLAVIPILLGVGYVWPIVLEFFNLPLEPQDLVSQVAGMSISPMFLAIAFLAVVLAPLSEELFFRAFLYRSLKGYMSPTMAAIVSSVFFAGMHFNWHSFLPLFVLGFWLCRTYQKTGNLWAPIILHAFFNGNTLVTLMLLGS
jgi:hypothetical protein